MARARVGPNAWRRPVFVLGSTTVASSDTRVPATDPRACVSHPLRAAPLRTYIARMRYQMKQAIVEVEGDDGHDHDHGDDPTDEEADGAAPRALAGLAGLAALGLAAL